MTPARLWWSVSPFTNARRRSFRWIEAIQAKRKLWLKTPSARRNNRRPIGRRFPRRLCPALHFYPDRKSNNRRPGSGAPGRRGSDGDTRRRGSSRRTGEPGRTSDGARRLGRSTNLSPKVGSGRRLSIGRERMPGKRPTLRGSQSNPSCRSPRTALVELDASRRPRPSFRTKNLRVSCPPLAPTIVPPPFTHITQSGAHRQARLRRRGARDVISRTPLD